MHESTAERLEAYAGLLDSIADTLALLPPTAYSMSTHELKAATTLNHMRQLVIDLITETRNING